MGGGWPDQARREDSRYSPSSLQASLDIWDTWNSLLGINRGEGNTKNTIFYHFINQKCCDSGQEKWMELKQLACTKTGSSVLAKGAKTDKFADSKQDMKEPSVFLRLLKLIYKIFFHVFKELGQVLEGI